MLLAWFGRVGGFGCPHLVHGISPKWFLASRFEWLQVLRGSRCFRGDCLDLRPSHLQAAYRALAIHDFVLGPASDGGYYLLGMRKVEPRLFQGKAWSTETVLQATLDDIAALGKTVELLPVLHDIDTEADYAAALQRNRL